MPKTQTDQRQAANDAAVKAATDAVEALAAEVEAARAAASELERAAYSDTPTQRYAAAAERLATLQSRYRRAQAMALAVEVMPDFQSKLEAADAAVAAAQRKLDRLVAAARAEMLKDVDTEGMTNLIYRDGAMISLEEQIAEREIVLARAHAQRLRRWPSRLLENAEVQTVVKTRGDDGTLVRTVVSGVRVLEPETPATERPMRRRFGSGRVEWPAVISDPGDKGTGLPW